MNRSKYSLALISTVSAHVLFPFDQELQGKRERDEITEHAAQDEQKRGKENNGIAYRRSCL